MSFDAIPEDQKPAYPWVDGEPDCEFTHIVRVNGKLHCNNCGDWDFLMHWLKFVTDHQGCVPV